MNSSTNVHASDGTIEWTVEDEPLYLALTVEATDELGGTHRVTIFTTWEQLADLHETLATQANIGAVMMGRARAALRYRATSAERSARANAVAARPLSAVRDNPLFGSEAGPHSD